MIDCRVSKGKSQVMPGSSKLQRLPPRETRAEPGAKANTREKESQLRSLLAAEAAWLKAYQSKDAAAAAAFYAEDGAMLAPHRPLLTGQSALTKFIAQSFRLEGYNIVWHAKKAAVARSGELGYTSGSYEMTFRRPRGKLFFDKGKYLMVWKKQPDGGWKVLFDMSNSDLRSDARRI
jgi:ketosteroid isomerase-like protein